MNKQILIVNGMARSGKDTFAEYLGDITSVKKYSSIDRVKAIARLCGWRGDKTEKDRKFLSDLKVLTSEYSDMPFKDITDMVRTFNNPANHSKVLIIDIREPQEIERAKRDFGAKTVLIKNDRVEMITSNMADAGVFDYEYDYVIENNGSLEEFRETVYKFWREVLR